MLNVSLSVAIAHYMIQRREETKRKGKTERARKRKRADGQRESILAEFADEKGLFKHEGRRSDDPTTDENGTDEGKENVGPRPAKRLKRGDGAPSQEVDSIHLSIRSFADVIDHFTGIDT